MSTWNPKLWRTAVRLQAAYAAAARCGPHFYLPEDDWLELRRLAQRLNVAEFRRWSTAAARTRAALILDLERLGYRLRDLIGGLAPPNGRADLRSACSTKNCRPPSRSSAAWRSTTRRSASRPTRSCSRIYVWDRSDPPGYRAAHERYALHDRGAGTESGRFLQRDHASARQRRAALSRRRARGDHRGAGRRPIVRFLHDRRSHSAYLRGRFRLRRTQSLARRPVPRLRLHGR